MCPREIFLSYEWLIDGNLSEHLVSNYRVLFTQNVDDINKHYYFKGSDV